MADPRTTAARLIALAVNPTANEHEARNAAMSACKLIQEHRLLEQRPEREKYFWFDELFRSDTFGARVYPPARERAEEPRPPPPQPSVPGSTPKRPPDHDSRKIPITMTAWCTGCGQVIRRGSYATWSRGEVWHSGCYKAATE